MISLSNESYCLAGTTGAASNAFTSALNFFAAAQCLIPTMDWPPDADLKDGEEFEFIIVGAGTAGSVLANRLSEVGHWKVLLLEAGGNPPIESDIPGMASNIYGTKHDWQFKSVNNGVTSQVLKNGTTDWPRGKMLGGSSSMNEMVYVRGNPYDYMKWYDAGNIEWHPDIVTKYFKIAEALQDKKLFRNPAINNFYGHNGPLVVNTFNSSKRHMTNGVLSAWDEIGIKTVEDLNFSNNLGSGIVRVTTSEGKRRSIARGYLNTIANKRSNLKVGKKSLVTRLLISPKLKIYGVKVKRSGNILKLFANKEVIVSSGTVKSPQLLMLSGIGPQKHLTSHGIRCLLDLPMVGQNLHEHAYNPLFIFANEPEISEADRHWDTLRYLSERKGYLAYMYPYLDVTAFYSNKPDAKYPKFQNLVLLCERNSLLVDGIASQYVESISRSISEQGKNHSLFYFASIIIHPYSRGNISLNSDDPNDMPLIHYNSYNDYRDLDAAVDGVKMLSKIVNSTYFKSIGGKLGNIDYEPCNSYVKESDEYWRCICLNMVDSVYHAVGTCMMGTDARTAVVDSRLRVYGTTGLRVVDGSIMPTITGGNTNAPITMIAERAADLIKQDNKMECYMQIEPA